MMHPSPLGGENNTLLGPAHSSCACRCQAEQTGRKRKVFPLHHLLPTGDGEGREGGEGNHRENECCRRGGDVSGLFSPSGGGAAPREPPSPGGSPAGPVVTSSLIGAGGQGSGSCGDLAGGS